VVGPADPVVAQGGEDVAHGGLFGQGGGAVAHGTDHRVST
jgi:hypothetical protein